jgi:hypothetical protein
MRQATAFIRQLGNPAERMPSRWRSVDPGRWLFGFAKEVPPHQNTVGHWWRKTREAPGAARSRFNEHASGWRN